MAEVKNLNENLYLRVNADDQRTLKVDGLTSGEKMIFKVFRPSTGEEFHIHPVFSDALPNAGTFKALGMSMITNLKYQTVSVQDPEEQEFVVHIFPNPATDVVSINTSADIENVEVMNLTGQVILQDEMNSSSGQLDISKLNPGTYLIRINFKNGRFVSKQLMIR